MEELEAAAVVLKPKVEQLARLHSHLEAAILLQHTTAAQVGVQTPSVLKQQNPKCTEQTELGLLPTNAPSSLRCPSAESGTGGE